MATKPISLLDQIELTRKMQTGPTKAQEVIAQSTSTGDVPVVQKPVSQPEPQPVPAPSQATQGQYTIEDVGKRLREKNPEALKGFTDAQIGERAIQRKPELSKLVSSHKEAQQPNFLQSLAQPFTDLAATGIRAAEGIGSMYKATFQDPIGLAKSFWGQEDLKGPAAETIKKAGEDINKPVQFKGLGEGQIRKIGSVQKGGVIVPSGETLKSLGTAGEIASYAMPSTKITSGTKLLPRLAVRGAEGVLAGSLGESGRTLRETGDLSQVPERALEGAKAGGLAGGIMGGLGRAAEKTSPLIGKVTESFKAPALASRVVNSIVKPLSKDFQFGKNPGLALAKNGIVGDSFEQLAENTMLKRKEIGEKIGQALSSGKAAMEKLDLFPALKSLDTEVEKAASSGNQALFTRLNTLRQRITNEFGVGADGKLTPMAERNLSNLAPQQANEIKQLIGEMVEWTEKKTEDDVANKALHSVYRSIKQQIEDKVPGIKQLNEDWGNLMTAENAIRYRDKIAQRANLISLPGIGLSSGAAIATAILSGGAAIPSILAAASGVALDKALKSPRVMTRVAAWLAKLPAAEKERMIREYPVLRNVLIQTFTKQQSKKEAP